jgi:hypothetical protein
MITAEGRKKGVFGWVDTVQLVRGQSSPESFRKALEAVKRIKIAHPDLFLPDEAPPSPFDANPF